MTNEELVALIQEGTNVTENMGLLYQQNIPLIENLIYPFTKSIEASAAMDKQDLMQEAYFGLAKAVQAYDASKEILFMTYAAFHIKQSVRRYKQKFDRTKRIPIHQLELISKYHAFRDKFISKYGIEPTQQEIIKSLEIKKSRLDAIEKVIQEMTCSSLDAIVPGSENLTYADSVADDYNLEETVTDEITTDYYCKAIWEAVSELPEKEKDVIIKRFKENLSLQQTADNKKLSFQYVSQLQAQGIRLLRRKSTIQEAALQYGYGCYQAYHFGVQKCKDTRSSSTEWLALKHLEMEERLNSIAVEMNALNAFKDILEGVNEIG